ncbi:stage II sporulation protein M [Neolewinella antarctica]|uniref:Membrane protein SpoIIM required for sporulation n=1 Tax=Neolewinella antarctica TaxID=442734 RepID=A0ABX0XDJ1_9BACT|nr:stage II sporulation protein M [Neolewinella antarctica]NJC27371.1 putative membrane protein SpoIIM required for sporulation [Neolewinella antarctica]
MRETDFINKNQEKWKRYERALEGTDQDPDLLTELYIHTTDDLSYSRTFYPNRSVRVYLNNLAQRTFLQVYKGRKGETSRFFSFWSDELPRTVHASRKPLLISLIIFLLAMLIGVVSYRIDSSFAETIMGQQYMDMTQANIAGGDPMAVYKETSPYKMALSITVNNIYVALMTFVSGAFFAVGSVVQLLRNGIMVGVFQYFFYDQGVFQESFLTIWIHGALEISSIVIAGGAGLTMGMGLLFPGTLSRFESFKRSARDGLKIMLGLIPIFIAAGFLESYLTRHTELPDAIRALFILLCFAFIFWYYYWYPKKVAAYPAEREYALPRKATEKDKVVSRRRIRGAGENMEASLSIARQSAGLLFGGSAAIALVFTALSLYFFGDEAYARYAFSSEFLLGDLRNYHELFTTWSRDRNVTYLLLVAAYFYGVFRLSSQIFWRATDIKILPASWRSEAYLFLVGLCAACVLSFGYITTALATLFLLPFVFILAYAGYSGLSGVKETLGNTLRNFGAVIPNFYLILVMVVPLMWLIDTALGGLLFSFLDWVIYADAAELDNLNAVLQTALYAYIFTLMFALLAVSFALIAYKLREINHADALLREIESVGTRRKLRGLEME